MGIAELAQQIDAAIAHLTQEGVEITANAVCGMVTGTRAEILRLFRERQGPSESGSDPHGTPGSDVRRPAPALPGTPPPPQPPALGGQLADAQRAFREAQRENGTVHEQVRQLEAERTGLIARQKALLAHRRAAETVVELRRIKQELQALEEDVEVVDNHLRRLHPRASAAAQCYHATQQRLFQVQEVATRTLLEGRGAMQWGGDGAQRRLREELTALLGSAEMERLLPTTTRPDWARP